MFVSVKDNFASQESLSSVKCQFSLLIHCKYKLLENSTILQHKFFNYKATMGPETGINCRSHPEPTKILPSYPDHVPLTALQHHFFYLISSNVHLFNLTLS